MAPDGVVGPKPIGLGQPALRILHLAGPGVRCREHADRANQHLFRRPGISVPTEGPIRCPAEANPTLTLLLAESVTTPAPPAQFLADQAPPMPPVRRDTSRRWYSRAQAGSLVTLTPGFCASFLGSAHKVTFIDVKLLAAGGCRRIDGEEKTLQTAEPLRHHGLSVVLQAHHRQQDAVPQSDGLPPG